MRISLETAVENLWKQFQTAQKHYNESTHERRKEFEKLQQKDQKSSFEIEQQMKKLAKIQENINALRQRMSANTKGEIFRQAYQGSAITNVKAFELNLHKTV